eukprot:NODE_333_length_9325_cov_0.557230.p1 type:complete len:771 gc:universal NODE_333_length_9325_cov_0.557230:7329-5017(-)
MRVCSKCGLPINSKYIKAFDQAFHIDCFTCVKCGKNVSDRFFHMNQQPFCEQDYFKEKGLICSHCNQLIKTSHVTFNQQKYHLHCFTCAICKAPFDKQASYFTVKHSDLETALQKPATIDNPNGMSVVCKYHYSIYFAMKCVGCILPILNQFVETSTNQCWHPECYMLYKTWNVLFYPRQSKVPGTPLILNSSLDGIPIEDLPAYLGYLSNSALPKQQVLQMYLKVQETISLLWHTLTAFEESLTNTIGELLQNFTANNYSAGLEQAALFVNHVEVLFECLDKFNKQKTAFDEQKECKFLAKKMIHFFTLLSHTQQDMIKKIGATQELLSLVTSMAQYLKVLIRTCVVMTLMLEHKGTAAVMELADIWNSLVTEIPLQSNLPSYVAPLPQTTMSLLKKEPLPMDRLHNDLHADLCTLCRQTIDDDSIVDNLIGFRWHSKCFPLDKKSREIIESTWKGQNRNSNFDDVKSFGYTKITKLGQYVFLLRVALRRLHQLLQGKEQQAAEKEGEVEDEQKAEKGLARRVSQKMFKRSKTQDELAAEEDNPDLANRPRSPSISNNLSGILKKSPSKKKLSISPSKDKISDMASRDKLNDPAAQIAPVNNPTGVEEDDEPVLLVRKGSIGNGSKAKDDTKNRGLGLSKAPQRVSVTDNTLAFQYENVPQRYMSELSSLEHIIIQHFAVLIISPYVEEHVSRQELLEAIGSRKEALLVKLVKTVKKPKGRDQLFGSSLELLTQRYGIDSNLGAGPGRLRVPCFVDKSIRAIKKKSIFF